MNGPAKLFMVDGSVKEVVLNGVHHLDDGDYFITNNDGLIAVGKVSFGQSLDGGGYFEGNSNRFADFIQSEFEDKAKSKKIVEKPEVEEVVTEKLVAEEEEEEEVTPEVVVEPEIVEAIAVVEEVDLAPVKTAGRPKSTKGN